MDVLYHIIIALALLAATPFILIKMAFDPGFAKDLKARLAGARAAPKTADAVWVHASSVGEVRAAKLIVQALKERAPARPVVVSTFTAGGMELAGKEGLTPLFRLPPDSPLWLAPLFARLRPSLLVLVEAELWPALLRSCFRRGVPVVLVNGRLSQRSFSRYRLIAPLFRWITAAIGAFAMRGEADAARLLELGIEEERVRVTGNIKFDQPLPEPVAGGGAGEPLVVFGSTRPGDEAVAAAALNALFRDFPGLRAVLAPRHLHRLEEVEAVLREHGLQFTHLGEGGRLRPGEVLLLDRLGELARYYPRARVAFVGGSFDPAIGGHNLLEPAAAGVPVVHGRHMQSFAEEAALLEASGGGIRLERPEDLLPTLSRLLADEGERTKRGRAASETVLAHRGAVERNIELIEKFLRAGEPGVQTTP